MSEEEYDDSRSIYLDGSVLEQNIEPNIRQKDGNDS